ncbi:MAG: porin, partial [Bacteroidales bacterium]|nr:porin [Bacteroidales bacterium]
MKTLRVLLLTLAVTSAVSAAAQGSNHGDGGPDGNYTSLSERLLNLEKKHDACNIFVNTCN